MGIIPQTLWDNNPEKQCTKCKQWFPATLDYFHKTSRNTLISQCKQCVKARWQARRNKIQRRDYELWTDGELAMLTDRYRGASTGDLKDMFPRHTLKSIRSKAYRLGLPERSEVCFYPWTEQEIAYLKTVYLTHSSEELATMFPRHTAKAIKIKANKLGLKKTQRGLYRRRIYPGIS